MDRIGNRPDDFVMHDLSNMDFVIRPPQGVTPMRETSGSGIRPIRREMPQLREMVVLGEVDPRNRPVFMSDSALSQMYEYFKTFKDEKMGVPIGYYCQDGQGRIFYMITEFIPLNCKAINNPQNGVELEEGESGRLASLMFDKKRLIDKDLTILGWSHSHPIQVAEASGLDARAAWLGYRSPLLTMVMNPNSNPRQISAYDLQDAGFRVGEDRNVDPGSGAQFRLNNKLGIAIYGQQKDLARSFTYKRG